MIIEIVPGAGEGAVLDMAAALHARVVHDDGRVLVITSSGLQTVPDDYQALVAGTIVTPTDIQLASPLFRSERRRVPIAGAAIGGEEHTTLVMTGPCSVESEEQLDECARFARDRGVRVLRAGCFKPRTSPYGFQGLGRRGLDLLGEMRDRYGLSIVTEVRDATHVDAVIEAADIVQIGAKAMYDQGILRRCGEARKPVLLKRGFGTTLQEFVQAAEFILAGGNDQVVLCERGIRTFETKTRFTLDLCGVAFLKQHTNLPVVVDPSHAMGHAYGVADLARAAVAMSIDGLLIESHPTPSLALSDAAQQLDLQACGELLDSLKAVAAAVGRRII